jgi:hypothetical protein
MLRFVRRELGIVPVMLLVATNVAFATEPTAPFRIQLDVVHQGWDGVTCFTQARAGIVPRSGGQPPIIVMTTNPLLVTGSDVYQTVHDLRSDDLGKTWTKPTPQPSLGRRQRSPIDGLPAEEGVCDLWPKWHAKTGKLLNIGHVVNYVDDVHPVPNQRRETIYTVYDPEGRTWTPWKKMMLPDGSNTYPAGAGCAQRVDLPNGDILLPVYGGQRTKDDPYTKARVIRLKFDGETLSVAEEGPELSQNTKRGFAEPSLTKFKDKFYLAIRHDDAGYCATSSDGLHFDQPKPWLWDDGTDLGNYNTQTHWVTHDDALFLCYTRRGANNDHVFRNRAPIFIAEIDPATLRVKRATERVLVPERGARYGNFGVSDISANETWVTETEWMQIWKQPSRIIPKDNPWGADNRIYAARILWDKPNTSWDKR